MIRTKPPSNEYRDGWDRIFAEASDEQRAELTEALQAGLLPVEGDSVADVFAEVDRCIQDISEDPQRERSSSWPRSHESDCPFANDPALDCNCPMGNL